MDNGPRFRRSDDRVVLIKYFNHGLVEFGFREEGCIVEFLWNVDTSLYQFAGARCDGEISSI